MRRLYAFIAIFLAILALFWNHQFWCSALTPFDSHAPLLNEAEEKLLLAFQATLDVERLDVNVSGLVVKLNIAAQLLADAKNAFKAGNITDATVKAENCSTISREVIGEASKLKSLAMAEAQKVFRQNLSFSVISSIIFILLMFYAWVRFKRLYLKRIFKMKPEVISDAQD